MSFKILTSGPGGPTIGVIPGSEAEIVKSADLAADGGSSLVGFLQSGTGVTARTVQAKLRDFVTPKDFGAKGDGTSDDTIPVRAAIKCGAPIHWLNGTYRITSPIEETILFQLKWISDGAKIFYDPPSPTQNAIKITVFPHAHHISGVLEIDCNRKAYNGLYLLSPGENLGVYPEGYPDLSASDVRIYRPYRAGSVITGGNAFLIEGGWNNVILTRPHAVDCRMAVGAEVLGEQGIFGISVMRIGSSTLVTPHNIVIEDCFIDGVISEDSNYQNDQDGIRVFTSYNAGGSYGSRFTYTVRGGIIKNCRNRSIKGQANLGKVNDVTFVRTNSLGGPHIGLTGEINEQIGSISSSNCEFFYEDYVPAFLYFGRTRVEGYKQPSNTISNVRGVSTGAEVITSLFAFTAETGAPSLHRTSISNVDFNGPSKRMLLTQSSSVAPNSQNIFNVSNLTGVFTESAIQDSGVGGYVRWNVVNCSNLSGTDVPVITSTGSTLDGKNLSCANLLGFDSRDKTRYSPSSGYWPNSIMTSGLVPEKNDGVAGIFKPIAFTLSPGGVFELPANSTAGTTSGLMLITTSRASYSAQAIFQLDQVGVYLVTTSTYWAAGTTSEPASGDYRMWIDSSSLRVKVSNRTSTARTFTAWMLG